MRFKLIYKIKDTIYSGVFVNDDDVTQDLTQEHLLLVENACERNRLLYALNGNEVILIHKLFWECINKSEPQTNYRGKYRILELDEYYEISCNDSTSCSDISKSHLIPKLASLDNIISNLKSLGDEGLIANLLQLTQGHVSDKYHQPRPKSP